MLLYWAMLEGACRLGATCFDFGRSTRDSGTHKFKKQWGAEDVPLHWHYLLAEGQDPPGILPDSPKYQSAVACWKKLPVWIACAIGPRIIGKLS
jgi:serine/alanine adding enzyme